MKTSTTATAKTSSERVKLLRERRHTLGLVRLELHADKLDHEAIKAFAKALVKKRALVA